MRSLHVWLTVLLCSWGTSQRTAASTYVAVPDAHLLDQADRVVIALLQRGAPRRVPAGILTEYGATVLETIKGDPVARLTVTVPGGSTSDLRVQVVGAPDLGARDRWLLFLAEDDEGSYRILHLNQGALFLLGLGDGARFEGLLDPAGDLRREASPALDGLQRHAARFVAWLHDRARGRRRPADYWIDAVPATWRDPTSAGWEASFTLNRAGQRWFEFDERSAVAWRLHEDGQPGLEDGGRRAFRRAMRLWGRRHSGAPVRLRFAGTTDSTAGGDRKDRLNTILFSDLSNVFERDFSCFYGGVIATAILTDRKTTPEYFKGWPYYPVQEADIVVNDGVECLFEGEPAVAAYVYAHELGHTLGLGHACGDRPGVSCSSSPLLDQALMRAGLPAHPVARLATDDVMAIRMLYDPDFWAAPCDLPPGHRRFCSLCGPCGEGQGHCRRDSDCYTGLICARAAGETHGLEPGINVCEPPAG